MNNQKREAPVNAVTAIIVHNPVDPRALFDAMRDAASNSGDRWDLDETCGQRMRMYRTRGGAAGAQAGVAVHFPDGGGLVPRGYLDGESDPDGNALGSFDTGSFADDGTVRAFHGRLIQALVPWFGARGLRWSWSSLGGERTDGTTAHATGPRALEARS